MGKRRKNVKKNKVVPCTDTNQHAIEHIKKIQKEREYYAKKLAEYRAKMMMKQQQRDAISSTGETSTVDGMSDAEKVY